ncbi:MAG: RNase adapter RapZ [Ruminococcaceae bacterium]|nr:RNase adapter RapZ [Oscillospiraceae bacterium]
MKFVIITGMSGAGKSQAINTFEDMGYFCVDNMPPMLFSKFAELCTSTDTSIAKVAFVIDSRGGSLFSEVIATIEEFEEKYGKCTILFLDADNDELVKRYKETRRKHPLNGDGNLTDGIVKERAMLEPLRQKATYIVNTSNMKTRQLQDYIKTVVDDEYDAKINMTVEVVSFGFKYGLPLDADLVYDVRFLPNPFYVPELKTKTGLDDAVSEYVMNSAQAEEYLKKLTDFMTFLLPNYVEEGKSNLVIAIGCTGGKHRSVTIANELYKQILSLGYNTYIAHRDINKDR